MNTTTALAAALSSAETGGSVPPRIGEVWPEQGGIYAGVVAGEEGAADAYLIFAENQISDEFTWQAGLDFARACTAGGFNDWQVASRWESPVLYAHLHNRIQHAWHWTRTQDAGGSDWAWFQHFGDGLQYYDRKSNEYPALLVRRVPIQ